MLAQAARFARPQSPLGWLRAQLQAVERTHARHASARLLVTLGDHELRDIGLTRADAEMLARNPDVLPDHLRRT